MMNSGRYMLTAEHKIISIGGQRRRVHLLRYTHWGDCDGAADLPTRKTLLANMRYWRARPIPKLVAFGFGRGQPIYDWTRNWDIEVTFRTTIGKDDLHKLNKVGTISRRAGEIACDPYFTLVAYSPTKLTDEIEAMFEAKIGIAVVEPYMQPSGAEIIYTLLFRSNKDRAIGKLYLPLAQPIEAWWEEKRA